MFRSFRRTFAPLKKKTPRTNAPPNFCVNKIHFRFFTTRHELISVLHVNMEYTKSLVAHAWWKIFAPEHYKNVEVRRWRCPPTMRQRQQFTKKEKKNESRIICLPFHPKSHRKLPETLTPDVHHSLHILRAKTTEWEKIKINLHECMCIRRLVYVVCERPLTRYSNRMHCACNYPHTHTHTRNIGWFGASYSIRSYVFMPHAYTMLNGTFIFRTFVPILAPPPTMTTTTANMCHIDSYSR